MLETIFWWFGSRFAAFFDQKKKFCYVCWRERKWDDRSQENLYRAATQCQVFHFH
jgi:hypothetical protein